MKNRILFPSVFYALLGFLLFGIAFPQIAFAGLAGALLFQALHFMPVPIDALAINAVSEQVKSLSEKRADLLRQMNAIYDTAKKRKDFKGLEENEKSTYNNLKTQFEALADPLKQAKELEKLNLEMAAAKGSKIDTPIPGDPANDGPSKEDKKALKQYSTLKMLRMAMGREKYDGFEKEMHEEGLREARELGVPLAGSGIVVPQVVLNLSRTQKRDIGVGSSGGGNAVATSLGDFIEYLNDHLVFTQLGANFMTGLIGNMDFPKEATVAAATWEGETDANAETSPTVSKISLTPKRLGAFIDVANQMLIQTSPSIETLLSKQLINAVLLGIEKASIDGSGTAPVPEGILSTTGIGSVAIGTNGGAITWAHIIDLQSKVDVANAMQGNLGYLTNSKVRGKLKGTPKVSGQPIYIWPDAGNEVAGFKAAVTNQVPSNLTKGSGTALSAVIFGNFADLLIGQWGGIEVFPNPYTKAKTAQTELIINTFADIAVKRAGSFSAIVDAVTV